MAFFGAMFHHNPFHPFHRQLMQQQIVQQQILLQQARSQEMLASSTPQHRPMALGADALYQQYGPPGRRSAVYQREMDVRNMANFTSLKQTAQQQQVSHEIKKLYRFRRYFSNRSKVFFFCVLNKSVFSILIFDS